MTTMSVPFGSWRSPVSAELLAQAGMSLGWLQAVGGNVYWVEGRPLEEGRYVIVRRSADGLITDLTPQPYNARTLVHEYGGGMYAVGGEEVYFSNFTDQRVYRQKPGEVPSPLTPKPSNARGLRYADGRVTPDGRYMVCIRESHPGGHQQGNTEAVLNELVVLPLGGGGEPRVIASGYDFYSTPRISPDGSRLAWLCWRNPQMPWDGTELWVATFNTDATLSDARCVAGGPTESIFQPEWSPDGILHFVSDRTDWWNLYREVGGQIEPLAPMAAEFGQPQWVFGLTRYAFMADGRIACIYSQDGIDYLGMATPGVTDVEPVPCPYTSLRYLSGDGQRLWAIGGSPTTGSTVFSLDPTDGSVESIRPAMAVDIAPEYFSIPRPVEFPTEEGLTAHALYYPPANPLCHGPAGERPPLLVLSHGGPTGSAIAQLSLSIQYWTSRGFAVVDVNYGGSTGYGRSYRERLKEKWGIVDVMDCVNAARHLIDQGEVDGARTAIRGGSAGGYTTLRALTWQDFFAAGASYYGLAELETFVQDTHKFEARYLDGLIGPYPQCKDLYYERSPVNSADQISCPVIIFQGLDDKVVPPSQAEIMVEALRERGTPHAYLAFEGEEHGFRRAKNIVRAAEAELYFYSRVFGFALPEGIAPVEIVNL